MQAGVGFMALDENQAKIASILLEYEETKKQIGLKQSELSRASDIFTKFGRCLLHEPLYTSFSGDPIPSEFANRNIARGFEPNEFDVGKIRQLLIEFRELELKMRRLKIERKAIGYPVD